MKDYKLIIADDEDAIRKGLVKSIPWDELGYRVVADFMDGEEIIAYLKENDVDVIFTDVRMCVVSGLEVARWIQENQRDIKVVMISGFREFDYIQKAMKYGVRDYVLKPLKPLEICEVFRKLKETLDHERKAKELSWENVLRWREDTDCKLVIDREEQLVGAVAKGELTELAAHYGLWCEKAERVLAEYFPVIVLHLLDSLYEHLDRLGLELSVENEKINRIHEIKTISIQETIEKLREILESITTEIHNRKKRNDSFDKTLATVRNYIDIHLGENFGVEQLAELVGLNRSYFSREFKMRTGLNVTEYILQRKIGRAIELAEGSKHTTVQIAELLGYSDVKYFRKIFKNFTGYSVTEYRNLMQQDKQ